MKITPLEIRQKSFEKHFRGYDKDEVHAFLTTLSQEWERVQDENKELRIRLESTEKEILKLREVESSLYKTLKTAEDTGAHVIDQARQTAELHLRESQLKAEALLNESKMKAKDTIEEAELRARQVLVEMEDRLKAMVESYKKLESTRDDLLMELKRISHDTMERVERIRNAQRDFDADKHLSQARADIKKVVFPNQPTLTSPPKPEPKPAIIPPIEKIQEEIAAEKTMFVEATVPAKGGIKSFFDEIG
jgi:cell division initiation protein